MRGHLIDCRAQRGFSGSPCLIQWHDYYVLTPYGKQRSQYVDRARREYFDQRRDRMERYGYSSDNPYPPDISLAAPQPDTDLLGVLAGFIGNRKPLPTNEDVRLTVDYPENTGVGVVVPVERIIDVLVSEPLTQERRERLEELMRRKKEAQEKDEGGGEIILTSDDEPKPGPDPERLKLDTSLDDVARRVMDAGKPEDVDDA